MHKVPASRVTPFKARAFSNWDAAARPGADSAATLGSCLEAPAGKEVSQQKSHHQHQPNPAKLSKEPMRGDEKAYQLRKGEHHPSICLCLFIFSKI